MSDANRRGKAGTTSADDLAKLLKYSFLSGPPSEFARFAAAFHSAMKVRDLTEQLQVDMVILASIQLRQVVLGLKADPHARHLSEALEEALGLYNKAVEELRMLRARPDHAPDVARGNDHRAREAARVRGTHEPAWSGILAAGASPRGPGLRYLMVRGTNYRALDVMLDILRGWPMEEIFLKYPGLTAADVRAIRGCEVETGCVIWDDQPAADDGKGTPEG
jgi:hypothetical protein